MREGFWGAHFADVERTVQSVTVICPESYSESVLGLGMESTIYDPDLSYVAPTFLRRPQRSGHPAPRVYVPASDLVSSC